MLIPIKQIILEFVGPMTVSKQNHDNKFTPKKSLPKTGIPANENGSLRNANTNATQIKKPEQNIVATNLAQASRKSGIPGGGN